MSPFDLKKPTYYSSSSPSLPGSYGHVQGCFHLTLFSAPTRVVLSGLPAIKQFSMLDAATGRPNMTALNEIYSVTPERALGEARKKQPFSRTAHIPGGKVGLAIRCVLGGQQELIDFYCIMPEVNCWTKMCPYFSEGGKGPAY